MNIKENVGLTDVENKDVGVACPTYVAAIREFRKTQKQKEDANKVREAEKLQEKPKSPEMNKGAKEMKLEKLMLEESLFNESVEDAKSLDGEYIEFPNGEVFTIYYEDGKLIAGGLTNAGLMPEFEIEYDDDFSADWNLQVLYDVCVKEMPELLNYVDESIKTRQGIRKISGLREGASEYVIDNVGIDEGTLDRDEIEGTIYGHEGDETYFDTVKFKLDKDKEDVEITYINSIFTEEEKEKIKEILLDNIKTNFSGLLEESKGVPDVAGFVKEIKEIVKPEDIDTHESDLYVKVSPEVTKLLKKYNMLDNPLLSKFIDQIEHVEWYDIPFGNLDELIKEKEKINESKQLNEGAGAGYTIEGELSDIRINKINDVTIEDGETAFGTPAKFAKIDLDADAIFDGVAESYYDGVPIEDAEVKITSISVNPNLLYDLGLPEFKYGDIELVDLQDRLGYGTTVKFKSDVIGGGWLHVPFNNKVESNRVDDGYRAFIDGIRFEFVDPTVVDYIDKGVQGELDEEPVED